MAKNLEVKYLKMLLYSILSIGKRTSHIEFASENMCMQSLHIPSDQTWRLHSDVAYYIEHRSRDKNNVKVYEQRRISPPLPAHILYSGK
jgi:hypothetical protein